MNRSTRPVVTRGFTLIELLVVIAVIAILMSILVPALGTARDKARGVVGAANLKGLGNIWQTYLNENGDSFTTGTQFAGMAGDPDWYRGEWTVALDHYMRQQDKLLLCPSAKTTTGIDMGDLTHAYRMPTYRVKGEDVQRLCSYGLNVWCMNPRQVTTTGTIQGRRYELHWRKRSTVEYAEDVPLMLDSKWRGGGPHYESGKAYAVLPRLPEDTDAPMKDVNYEMGHFQVPRHSDRVNVLFVDGHVELTGIKALYRLRWHIDYPVAKYLDLPDSFWPKWVQTLPE